MEITILHETIKQTRGIAVHANNNPTITCEVNIKLKDSTSIKGMLLVSFANEASAKTFQDILQSYAVGARERRK